MPEQRQRQADAACLNNGFGLGKSPVPVNAEHGSSLSLTVRNVGVGRHADAGPGLYQQFLYSISVPLKGTDNLRVKVTCLTGKTTP